MPVLVIAVSCLIIFAVMGVLGVAAVHFERRQQVREGLESGVTEPTPTAEPVVKAV